MTSTNWVHTADNEMPPLDPDMEGVFEDLADVQDPGIDQILAGLRHIALTPHSIDRTQTLIAVLAGGSSGLNLVALIGQLVARLATADTNPALRTLPDHQQKIAQLNGEATAFALSHDQLTQFASDTSAAIDGI